MALGLEATIPASGGALGLSLLRWPLAGRPSMASDAQYCSFKPDPLYRSGWAVCPCAVSSSRGQAVHHRPGSRAKGGGGASTRPACPAVVLKLQDSVNLVPLAQQGCSSSSILRNASCAAGSGSLSQGAAAVVLAPPDGRTHLQESGQACVLNARHSTGLPSPTLGHGAPQYYSH